MFYKYKAHISIILFIVLSIFLCKEFGYTGCSDGSGSSSIGKRGACSHHGGVSSNIFLLLFVSFVTSAGFYLFTDSKYRAYANLVVLSTLPKHPLEVDLKNIKKFDRYRFPTCEAKSKQDFTCCCCKSLFKAGVVYKYYSKGSKRTKYCNDCAESLSEKNADISNCEKAYNELKANQNEQVYSYYLENAKAKLS